MYKRILIATDGSPLSDYAVKAGVELASALKSNVIMAHVGAPYTPPLYAGDLVPNAYVTADAHNEHVKAAADEILGKATDLAKAAGLQTETAFEIADEPADGLIEIAKEKNADMIVVASHGRGGLSALLLGSATRRLLTNAKIDLLVVRNYDADAES